jgi:hypothetical protein
MGVRLGNATMGTSLPSPGKGPRTVGLNVNNHHLEETTFCEIVLRMHKPWTESCHEMQELTDGTVRVRYNNFNAYMLNCVG